MKHFITMLSIIIFVAGTTINNCYSNSRNIYSGRINQYLEEGKIREGIKILSEDLADNPRNDNLRFAVGLIQFIGAVENLGQSWYRYGLRAHRGLSQSTPFFRLPVPQNNNPEPITNRNFRKILNNFINDLAICEKTLSKINSKSITLPLFFGRTYFDFDGDGQPSEQEALWRIYLHLNNQAQVTEEQANNFIIKLDAGDVKWLQAYCHFLSGLLEFYLAYDDTRVFDHTAHIFFEKPKTPYDFLTQKKAGSMMDYTPFIDAIALIHLINLPLKDADRTRKALTHFRLVTKLSRESWKLYMAETDNDCEWIPNPKQTGVIPGVTISEEMVQQWFAFLDELDDILSGKKLIPFWRGVKPLGINLKRVFTQPKQFDLLLWIQGTAAEPYLETRELTKQEFWKQLQQSFNGQFIGFALWFN